MARAPLSQCNHSRHVLYAFSDRRKIAGSQAVLRRQLITGLDGRPVSLIHGRTAVVALFKWVEVPTAHVSQERHPGMRLPNAWLGLGASRDELVGRGKVWSPRCWASIQPHWRVRIYILVCPCLSVFWNPSPLSFFLPIQGLLLVHATHHIHLSKRS